jgi:hypothetical protein
MKRSCIHTGGIQIPEQQQLVMAAPNTYGLGFRRAKISRKLLEFTFICIKPQAHIKSEPATIIILVQRPFSAHGAATPYFGLLGPVYHVESNSDVS